MILNTDKPGMVFKLYDFNKTGIGVDTSSLQSGLLYLFQVFIVELITMAMTFFNDRLSVSSMSLASFFQFTGIGTQSHRTTFHGDFLLLFHHVDDGIFRLRIKFSRACFKP